MLHEETTAIHRSRSNDDTVPKPFTVSEHDVAVAEPLPKVPEMIRQDPLPPQPVKQIGTLNISAATSTGSETSIPAHEVVDPLKALSKATGVKKVINTKKGHLGAKKLNVGNNDVKIESFESVEKRLQNLTMTPAANESENAPSRISSFLNQESNSPNKPLQDNKSITAPSSIYRSVAPATSVNHSYDSKLAREKYGSAKSISSDQFFGRDQIDSLEMKSRLELFSGSQAISSDMLYNNGEGSEISYNRNSDDFSMDRLKDSVSDFFKDLQKRVG